MMTNDFYNMANTNTINHNLALIESLYSMIFEKVSSALTG